MRNFLNSIDKLTDMHFPGIIHGIVILFCAFFPLRNASAEEIPPPSAVENIHVSPSEDEDESNRSFFDALWGQSAMDSVYLGMWSYHFVDDSDEYQTTHNLVGLTYKGIFLGTFSNSLNDQAWGGGLQRDIYRTTWGVLSAEMGYRVGVLYGYDKMELFDSGFFPLVQLYSDIRYKNFGMQFSWGGSALTAGFLVRF